VLDRTNITGMCHYMDPKAISSLRNVSTGNAEYNVSFTNCMKNAGINNSTNNTTICEYFFKSLKTDLVVGSLARLSLNTVWTER